MVNLRETELDQSTPIIACISVSDRRVPGANGRPRAILKLSRWAVARSSRRRARSGAGGGRGHAEAMRASRVQVTSPAEASRVRASGTGPPREAETSPPRGAGRAGGAGEPRNLAGGASAQAVQEMVAQVPGTRNPESEIQNLESGTRNPKPGTRNPKPEIRNL